MTAPTTMSTIWDRTTEFVSERLATLTPIVAFGIFLPLFLSGIFSPMVQSKNFFQDLPLGLIVVALSLVTIWGGLAVTALVLDPAEGRTSGVRWANRRFLPVMAIILLVLVISLVLMVPVGIAIGMSGVDPATFASGKPPAGGHINGGALTFVAFYAIALFLFGIWASARFLILIAPIMLMERPGVGVFGRSFVLTRGVGWKIIGVSILYFAVSLVATTATKSVLGSILKLLLGGEGPLSASAIAVQFAVTAVSTVLSVFATVFTAKLYLAARDAREAIAEAS